MKYSRIILLLWLSGLPFFSQAQNDSLVPSFMSADVATLGKYGSYTVGYNSGTPDITVPLHEIQENGVRISLALSYDATGCIPNKNAGSTGLNWQLIAGGAITRQVHGAMDDLDNPSAANLQEQFMHSNIGFIYGQQHNMGTYDKEQVRQVNYVLDYQGTGYPHYSVAYDYEPDIFSFNFLGHSGRFFMGNDGQVRVSGDREYKVDLSGFKGQYDFSLLYGGMMSATLGNLRNESVSQIILTADDGYRFYFGGAMNALEISFICDVHGVAGARTGCINAWYLTKVISPDGREISFSYQQYTADDLLVFQHLFDTNIGYWTMQPDGFLEPKFFWDQEITARNKPNTAILNSGHKLNMTLIKTAYLTQIQTANETIDLSYSQKDLTIPFYDPDSPVPGGQYLRNLLKKHYSQRLDHITILSAEQYRQVNLDYVYHRRRMFLNQVTIDDKTYKFLYKDSSLLPDPLTRGIDVWGYYNGHDDNTDLVLQPGSSPTDYEVNPGVPGADRRADTSAVRYGLLEWVSYPTGGTTHFLFESNSYSKVLKRTVTSGLQPVWVMQSGLGPGVRIRQITNTPGETTYFKYIKDYDQNPASTVSSGLLSVSGIYYLNYTSGSEYIRVVTSDNMAAAASYSEPPLTYSEVIQVNSPGFTKFTYSTHETNPDTYSLGPDSYKISTEYSLNNFNGQLLRLYKYSSREMERGKLLEQTVYNNQSKPVKTLQYTYNTSTARDTAAVFGIYRSRVFRNWETYNLGLYQSYALYYYQNAPTKVIETSYNPTGLNAITNTTTYNYRSDTRAQLSEMTVTDSKGQALVHLYKYPEDFKTQEPYATMVGVKNMLSPVVQQEVYKNNTTQFLSSSRINYSFFNNQSLIKPSSAEARVLSFPVRTKQRFNRYDQWGNLLERETPGGHKEVYLWGFEHSYPVAQISGSDYTTVSSVVSPAYIDSITRSSGGTIVDTITVAQKLQNYLSKLRTDARTKKASVRTFSYEPLNGLSAKGTADGQLLYFEYDDAGRLEEVIDNEGKILKAYEYHYKQ